MTYIPEWFHYTSAPTHVNVQNSLPGDNGTSQAASASNQLDTSTKDAFKPASGLDFGKIVAQPIKGQDKPCLAKFDSEPLEATIGRKVRMDDLQYCGAKAASDLFGLPMPDPSTHYYPTGQTGILKGSFRNYKVAVYKSSTS